MFKFPITNQLTLFARNFFKTLKEPSLQLPLVVSKVFKTYLFVDSVGFSSELKLREPTLFHNFLIVAM